MTRRYRPEHRIVTPDIRFNSPTVAVFVNKVMHSGKKSTARGLIYGAMDIIAERKSDRSHVVL